MWPAWGYGLCAPLFAWCVRSARTRAPFRTRSLRAAFTNEPITPPSSRTHGRARTPGPAVNVGTHRSNRRPSPATLTLRMAPGSREQSIDVPEATPLSEHVRAFAGAANLKFAALSALRAAAGGLPARESKTLAKLRVGAELESVRRAQIVVCTCCGW